MLRCECRELQFKLWADRGLSEALGPGLKVLRTHLLRLCAEVFRNYEYSYDSNSQLEPSFINLLGASALFGLQHDVRCLFLPAAVLTQVSHKNRCRTMQLGSCILSSMLHDTIQIWLRSRKLSARPWLGRSSSSSSDAWEPRPRPRVKPHNDLVSPEKAGEVASRI